MKKRVRIYKSPDGEGKFINKTAQFLSKAQMGGVPNADMMGYPGAASQQNQATSDDQLASAVLTDIGNSEPRERIIIKLVNVYGKEPMEAQQFVDQIYQYVEQQKDSEIDEAESEDDGSDAVTMGADTVEEAMVSEEESGPTGTQMSNEIIDEWDSSSDDDNQAASDIIMRYGGYPKAQDGMEVPIMMPDVSAYLPYGMADYLSGSVDPMYGQAWQQPTNDQVAEEEQVFDDYTEPELPAEYRRGGSLPSKKSYVKAAMNLAKKQMGGDSAAQSFDDSSDFTGANVRKKALDKFIGSVKNQSSIALAKQQAEQEYEQMLQQQQMQQYPMAQMGGEQDVENPMHHLALFSQAAGDVFQDDQNQMTQAQFGGWFRNRRRNPYFNAMNMVQNFGQGISPISRIDVRKSGLFGRPKQYSIDFSPMPGMGMPNVNLASIGYGPRVIKTPAERIKVETEAASVNQEAKKEVSNTTPDSQATTDAAKTDVTTTVSTSTEGTVGSVTEPGKTEETVTVTENGKTQTVPVNASVVKRNNSQEAVVKPAPASKTPVAKKSAPAPVYAKKYDRTNYLPSQQYEVNDLVMGPEGSRETLKTFVDPASGKTMVLKNPFNYKPLTKPAAEQVKKQFNVPVKTPKRGFAPTAATAGQTLWQMGGSINDPFADQYGNLQQFTGGGYDEFTQEDLDDVYSKDTANADFPMAQRGGILQTLFPANIMPRRYGSGYAQMRGVPYDPRTKMPRSNFTPGPGKYINKVDVTKSNWLTGAPKKYTVTYGETMIGPRNAPGLPNSGTTTPQTQMRQPERTAIPDDLSLRARMAINAGERKVARNDRRIARDLEYNDSEGYNNPNVYTGNANTSRAIKPTNMMPINMDGPSTYDPYANDFQNYMQESLRTEQFQDGGDLRRFIPRAQAGAQSPVSYANNPAVARVTETYYDKNNKPRDIDFTNIFADYANANVQDSSGGYEQETSVDYKAEKAPRAFDGEALINTVNAGVRGVTGLLNRRGDEMNKVKMMDNLSADNLYASDPSKDRGDYDTNTGLYRPDEMGQSWNSRSKQYGGNIYEDGGMVEGDEVFMTEEEIQDFLANGGDLEFI